MDTTCAPFAVCAQSHCLLSATNLVHNVRELRRLVSPAAALYVVVKANAYGHGLAPAVAAFMASGAVDGLAVDSLAEAAQLRHGLVAEDLPLIVLGNVCPADASAAVALGVECTVYDEELLRALSQAGAALSRLAAVHLKLETGNNRQGLGLARLLELARLCRALPGLRLRGLSTHFADIEDTTDHTFAGEQLRRFREAATALAAEGLRPEQLHCANSAATILWSEAHFDVVRVGIAAYGMWPSRETYISALTGEKARPELRPALSWLTRVAQVKSIAPGETVGYGRTYYATHQTRIAVLPVGYYDGYDRRLSNQAHVLVGGQRAPVRGRVCMNMTMVDVTDIPGVVAGDPVVLLGAQQRERIAAEQLADWMGTINYEVTTRIAEHVRRQGEDSLP